MISSVYYRELTGEYRSTFMDIYIYLQSSNINISLLNSIIEDVGDMLLSAQKGNRSTKDIVGNDVNRFCEDIINASSDKKDRFLQSITRFNASLAIAAIASFLFGIFNEPFPVYIVFTLYLNLFGIKILMDIIFKKMVYRFKGMKIKTIGIILIVFFASTIILGLNLLIINYLNIIVNGYYSGVAFLLVFLCIHFICKKSYKDFSFASYFK